MEYPKISIILINWNGYRDTVECLNSLQKISYPKYEIIIVDNGSENESVEKISEWCRKNNIRLLEYNQTEAKAGGSAKKESTIKNLSSKQKLILVRANDNLGFAGGNNLGIKYSLAKNDSDFILLLNNDTLVKPDFLTRLAEPLMQNPSAGAASPKIYYASSPKKIWYAGGTISLWNATPKNIEKIETTPIKGLFATRHTTGCATIIKKEVFLKCGLLDEDFFFLHEDCEFSLRMRKNKFNLFFAADSVIYHKIGESGSQSPLNCYFAAKHRILLLKKHGTPADKILFPLFFIPTRIIKFAKLLIQNDLISAKIEILAVKDLLKGKYGKNDKAMVPFLKKMALKNK